MSRFVRSAMSVMRAVRVLQYGGPEQLQLLQDVPIPKPSPTQVLIKVYAAGVNPVDTYLYAGTYGIKPPLPLTPGGDLGGVVEEVGADIKHLKVGDRVYASKSPSGSCAQYALGDAEFTFALHENLSFEQGAAIGIPYYTAYRALIQRCHARPGQSVLVHGASGAVGLACCQMARTLGLTVYGTAGTEKGLELVRQNGAHRVFSHRKDGYIEDIKAATDGTGVNLVMEMLSNVNLENDLTIAAVHGQIAVIGSKGSIEITPRHTMVKELSIHGVMPRNSTQEERLECMSFLSTGQEQGWIKPVVGQVFSLDEVASAHKEVIAHTGGSAGKIVLKIDH